MNFADALDHATELMSSLDKRLDGLTVADSMEARVSAALLHLSLEHFGAIVVLLQNRLSGSASALLRLQYEALIRGMYFYHCASENDAKNFFEGANPPKINIMIQRLEEKPGLTSGAISRVHSRTWDAMNSYTHGGAAQVQRRYSGSDLANHYSELDQLQILRSAEGVALLAATHAAIVCGAMKTASDLQMEFGNSLITS
jgi:hypothetical protein